MTQPAETWLKHALDGRYRARWEATPDPAHDYVIDGILPTTGASVWFGAGSVGKTQLLLWMAAHLAAPESTGITHWLGRQIRRRGHILVLSAEDLREHLHGRLRSVIGTIASTTSAVLDPLELTSRIHVLPFLSLELDEFQGASPALFRRGLGGQWGPSPLLRDVERFIDHWNTRQPPGERIVGVILDSAVSMAGFDLAHGEATTSFLFHINRTARRQNVFWAVIGHTPKSVASDPANPQSGAVGRLRGSAMWSTSPRTVVEVRTATRDSDLAMARSLHPGLQSRDLIQISVVKANSKGADFRTRTLRRLADGAFEDLSAAVQDAGDAMPDQGAVLAAVIDAIRAVSGGGAPGAKFSRADLKTEIERRRTTVAALRLFDTAVAGAEARKGNLADLLRQFAKDGVIQSPRSGPATVVDLDRAGGEGEAPPLPPTQKGPEDEPEPPAPTRDQPEADDGSASADGQAQPATQHALPI